MIKLLLPLGPTSERREIADGLASYWSAVEAAPDAELLSQQAVHPLASSVSSFNVVIQWPGAPVFIVEEHTSYLKNYPSSSPGPYGIKYSHLLSLGCFIVSCGAGGPS